MVKEKFVLLGILFALLSSSSFSQTASKQPLSKSVTPCKSGDKIQVVYGSGGDWSKCDATMEGPELLCNDEDGTFKANLKGSLPDGCNAGTDAVKWSTSFNNEELTQTSGEGKTFTSIAKTAKNRRGTITAKHPCCGEAKRDLTLNGDLLKPKENTEITDITPDVTADDFKEQLNLAVGDEIKISDEDRRKIQRKVESALRSVSEELPDTWVDLEERAKELVPEVVKKIKKKINKYNQAVEDGVNTAANRMEKSLNGLTPNVTLYGTYKHRKCSCDPGSPGWSDETGQATGTTGLSVKGGVSFQTDIDLSPAGVGITISVSANAEISFSVDKFGVKDGTVTISPATDPSSTVSGTPHVILSSEGSFSGGAGATITVGGSIEKTYEINRVSEQIKHDCSSGASGS